MNCKKITDSETTIIELMIPSYDNFGGKLQREILLRNSDYLLSSLVKRFAFAMAS